ncbi:hypothetical protein [Paractinoplanes toevensis]|uniref:hypothetical protein n=1 Tax=Paractinoplanes toevensis TaxID=571911 RepID=UPI001BB3BE8A|nr:hypothetical protein [Actinoplanes toevensis]
MSPPRWTPTAIRLPRPATAPMAQTTSVAVRATLLPRRSAMPSTTNSANTITAKARATAAPSQTIATYASGSTLLRNCCIAPSATSRNRLIVPGTTAMVAIA